MLVQTRCFFVTVYLPINCVSRSLQWPGKLCVCNQLINYHIYLLHAYLWHIAQQEHTSNGDKFHCNDLTQSRSSFAYYYIEIIH